MVDKLGIIAGGKDLPGKIIAHCRATSRPYHVLAFKGQTDPQTIEGSEHTWLHLGAVGKAIEALTRADVKQVVMVGPMRRPAWHELRPDAMGAKWLAKLAKGAFGDDSMFRIIIDEIEKQGFKVIGADELIGDQVLATLGVMGRHQPDAQAMKDIQHGIAVTTLIGQADIGQAAIIQDGLVLGVEAAEGTNGLITRCKELARKGLGPILIKMSKPQQDRRVDLPTIGPETIALAHQSGLRGIAMEANAVQILHRETTIQEADNKGLFLIGIQKGEQQH